MINTKKHKKTLELLAPAGNLDKLKFALEYGADAVYAGIPDYSLRVRINDFDLESLHAGAEYCHARRKKIFITLNIFAHNRHLEKLPGYVRELKNIGVDGLIVSDPGIMSVIKKIWPQSEIHLSTQANCTNWQSAKFWFDSGIKRVILGREVTLEEIKEIHKRVPNLELEYFVHGAMCMAYSGRCFLSKEVAGRSANLGDCIQPCRWNYKTKNQKLNTKNENSKTQKFIYSDEPDSMFELVEEEHGSYLLNSKDLCLIKHLDALIDAGVTSFKIEGRAKSVYYQAVVVGAYRIALNSKLPSGPSLRVEDKTQNSKFNNVRFLYKELETKLVHRGYTTGFLLGNRAEQNIENSHNKCDWEFCGTVENCEKQKVKSGKSAGKFNVFVKVHNQIRKSDRLEILTPEYDIIKMKAKEIIDPETGDKMDSAHGGQGRTVVLSAHKKVPVNSVVRRYLKSNSI